MSAILESTLTGIDFWTLDFAVTEVANLRVCGKQAQVLLNLPCGRLQPLLTAG
jgi:hypothetical protein